MNSSGNSTRLKWAGVFLATCGAAGSLLYLFGPSPAKALPGLVPMAFGLVLFVVGKRGEGDQAAKPEAPRTPGPR